MRSLRQLFILPLLLTTTVLTQADASEVRDKAKLFSAEAVKKADAELQRIERETNVPVTIETVDSLNGRNMDQAMRDLGKAEHIKGLFVLIAAKEKKNDAGASKDYDPYFRRVHYQEAYKGFLAGFKAGEFDRGLAEGVSQIETTIQQVKTEAGGTITPKTTVAPAPRQAQQRRGVPAPGAPQRGGNGIMTLVWIVVGIFAVMFVFRMIGAMLGGGNRGYGGGPGGMGGGPGYGGPGYGGGYGGGGGGGFMSSLFGGIGGAMAGNWLYDQFSGRHRGGYGGDEGYAPPVGGEAPPADNGEWGNTAGDGGGDWGSGSGGDAGGGGGGGGDWGLGGGGGGGDWGGSGGGDWGGGGGDGGSW